MNEPFKPPAGAPTILVVEPDPELRRYLRRCLGSLPTPAPRVLEAEGLEQARAVLRGGGIDLVVGVLNGPGSGGAAFCAALGIGDRGQIPVLLLATGVSSVTEIRGVRSLTATTLLPGTPNASRLCRTASRILARELPADNSFQWALPTTPPVVKRPIDRREEE